MNLEQKLDLYTANRMRHQRIANAAAARGDVREFKVQTMLVEKYDLLIAETRAELRAAMEKRA